MCDRRPSLNTTCGIYHMDRSTERTFITFAPVECGIDECGTFICGPDNSRKASPRPTFDLHPERRRLASLWPPHEYLPGLQSHRLHPRGRDLRHLTELLNHP